MVYLQPTQSWPPSMPPRLPKYVQPVRSKGRVYYYFRYRTERHTLPEPDTPAFHERYAELLRRICEAPAPRHGREGSVGWLIASYKASPSFTSLAVETQRSYDRQLERLRAIEAFPAVDVRRRHINAIRDQLAATPRLRQLFGQVCSLLFSYGIRELDLEMFNPAAKMRRDGEAESYAAWTPDQMLIFEQSKPPCQLLTAYMIGRYTGPRRGDIAGLRRNHWDGKGLSIPNSKTGAPLYVQAHPRLAAYLNGLPATLTLVADAKGRPVHPNTLSKQLRAHLDAIGLEGLSFHGLRHTVGKELAEAGCSEHEIAAVLGHASLQMVQRYTSKARQKSMAKAAVIRLSKNKNKT